MDIIRTIEETDCAIATSGDYEQNFRVGDKVYSHIIDPRSGLPVQGGVVGATVIHPSSCMKADALATTFSVLGEEGTRRFIEKYKDDFGLRGLEVYLYVLDDDGGLSEVHIKVEAALKELQKKNEELQ
jgi:thiamine biosynthesis lipoprotein